MAAATRLALTLGMATLALGTAESARSEGWRFGTGAEYTTGEYGATESIEEVYAPVSASWQSRRLGVRVTVPYLRVSGPGSVLAAGPGGEVIPVPGGRVAADGLGDVLVSMTVYDVISPARDTHVDLSGRVKLGTADADQGLGTGENDYSAEVNLLRDFSRATAYALGGYKWRGDPPDVDLEDVAYGAIGGDYLASRGVRLGLVFDFRQSSLPGYDDIRELSAYAVVRLNSGITLQPYLIHGLSDSSPEWGAGISLGLRVSRRER